MIRDCLDGNNKEVERSNCVGCDKTATNESALWVFDKRQWPYAKIHCEQNGGTLFGVFGAVAERNPHEKKPPEINLHIIF